MEQAAKEDPYSPPTNSALVRSYLWTKRYQDAIAQARKELEIFPTRSLPRGNLGLAYTHLQRYDEAVATLQDGLKLNKDHPFLLGFLGYAYGLSGKRAEAEDILNRLQKMSPQRGHRAFAIATVYTGLGDKDQALRWLNESRDHHDIWIILLKVDPQWESLRSDPRYTELLKRMGLGD
jgi:tetratricopeptide (TPR) repeat protein